MVVLAPGREIGPNDIPDEVRRPGGSSDLLPVPVTRAEGGGDSTLRPQLEFIFRTLVEMRMDMDDLRKEFEEYRSDHTVGGPPQVGMLAGPGTPAPLDEGLRGVDILDLVEEGRGSLAPNAADPPGEPDGNGQGGPEGVVVYRPGMTMEEMEREAIRAALAEVEGNRRKAAELLGIGERTLYRKIRKFDLDL